MNGQALKDASSEISALSDDGARRMMFERWCSGILYGLGMPVLFPRATIFIGLAAMVFILWRPLRRWQARGMMSATRRPRPVPSSPGPRS